MQVLTQAPKWKCLGNSPNFARGRLRAGRASGDRIKRTQSWNNVHIS